MVTFEEATDRAAAKFAHWLATQAIEQVQEEAA